MEAEYYPHTATDSLQVGSPPAVCCMGVYVLLYRVKTSLSRPFYTQGGPGAPSKQPSSRHLINQYSYNNSVMNPPRLKNTTL